MTNRNYFVDNKVSLVQTVNLRKWLLFLKQCFQIILLFCFCLLSSFLISFLSQYLKMTNSNTSVSIKKLKHNEYS